MIANHIRRPDPTPDEIELYTLELQKEWDEIERFRRKLPVSIVPYRTWGVIAKQPSRHDAMVEMRRNGLTVPNATDARG